MKVLSCKVTNQLAGKFRKLAEDKGETVASLLTSWVKVYTGRPTNSSLQGRPTKPHTAMDAIMALPVYDPDVHQKGSAVRVYDQRRASWSRVIVP